MKLNIRVLQEALWHRMLMHHHIMCNVHYSLFLHSSHFSSRRGITMGCHIEKLKSRIIWGSAWVILSSVLLAGCFIPNGPMANEEELLKLDTGNIAWMLAATGLVLFMTPGLAFFYGQGAACMK